MKGEGAMAKKHRDLELAAEHPVGAGYDSMGHRGSSVGSTDPHRQRFTPWLLGLAIAVLGTAVLLALLGS
jgi:hypothetical protein